MLIRFECFTVAVGNNRLSVRVYYLQGRTMVKSVGMIRNYIPSLLPPLLNVELPTYCAGNGFS